MPESGRKCSKTEGVSPPCGELRYNPMVFNSTDEAGTFTLMSLPLFTSLGFIFFFHPRCLPYFYWTGRSSETLKTNMQDPLKSQRYSGLTRTVIASKKVHIPTQLLRYYSPQWWRGERGRRRRWSAEWPRMTTSAAAPRSWRAGNLKSTRTAAGKRSEPAASAGGARPRGASPLPMEEVMKPLL